MKISLQLSFPPNSPKEERTARKQASLQERIAYAIDCMTCGIHKEKALHFLQTVHAAMEVSPNQDRVFQDLKEKVETAIADYGFYFPGQRPPKLQE